MESKQKEYAFKLWCWQYSNTGCFSDMIFTMFGKADPENKLTLGRAFPDHSAAYFEWMASPSSDEYFQRHDLPIVASDELNQSVFYQAHKKWGSKGQYIKTAEECVELAEQCFKMSNGRGSEDAVCEEMADVWIMLQQLKVMVHVGKFEEIRQKKINKLQGLLEVKPEVNE